MKKQRRRHGTTQLSGIFLVWGCSVYDSSLLGDQAGAAAGGAGGTAVGVAGEAGSGASDDSPGGSPGTAGGGSSSVSGSGGSGGVGGSGGTEPVASAGDSSTSAGADTGGEGGAVACTSETTAEFCTRVGKNCGAVDGVDNCGKPIVQANCGACQGFKLCGGAGEDNVCGVLTDPAGGGVPTASTFMTANEDGSKAFDLSAGSKWYAGNMNSTGWLAYTFSGTTTHIVTSYSVTSGNDFAQRDPSAWQLQGSNNGSVWITLDQQTAQMFTDRFQTNSYTCANSTAYRAYRILIGTNNGSTALQVAELALYGK